MSGITSPSDIPTLADLYAQNVLGAPEDKRQYPVNEELNKRISIWRGDITKLKADMIVNAANESLLGGGGVDGAIHRAAGDDLVEECETLGGAQTGETKVTKGYKLPAKWVAHTVGPVYSQRNAETAQHKLESCYSTSLELCKKHGGGSIGFSSISTGIYGYPIIDATDVALNTTRKFLDQDGTVTRVIYVVFSKRDEEVYQELAPKYFPAPPRGTRASESPLTASA